MVSLLNSATYNLYKTFDKFSSVFIIPCNVVDMDLIGFLPGDLNLCCFPPIIGKSRGELHGLVIEY